MHYRTFHIIVFVCLFVCLFRAHQTEDLTTSLTVIAHHHYIHGYFENEKLLFSLLLALEVCNTTQYNVFMCLVCVL